ncbi:hypothetical protein [Pseudolysinimonas sp.]|uniref:hypothetical protein n=1 Tax=Pseudolysinimonas sp. TaxID=2680009 RepID=UPI003F7EDDF2
MALRSGAVAVVAAPAEVVTEPPALGTLQVRYGDVRAEVAPGSEFSIGRDADLTVDDNPYVQRRFLRLHIEGGLWWIENTGRLSARLTDGSGQLQASLPPGTRLPLVFDRTRIVFAAGTANYELEVSSDAPVFGPPVATTPTASTPTADLVGHVPLTRGQRRLIVALAEPLLRDRPTGRAEIPGSAEAADRLGWTLTAFNRKLDTVCEKLDRIGVTGLRGGRGNLATNRRLRLVEHAVATRLVTVDDLGLLDAVPDTGGTAA